MTPNLLRYLINRRFAELTREKFYILGIGRYTEYLSRANMALYDYVNDPARMN